MAVPADGHRSPADPLERVADVARRLAEADTLDRLLQRVVDLGEAYLDRCDGASLMLVGRGGRVSTPAYSSTVARDSDLAQYETGEGPCLGAMEEHATLVIDDLESEQRWPAYRQRALALGIRSMISFRLFFAEDTLGALAFYGSAPNAFDRESRLTGQVFASHAAVALKAAITEAGLAQALRSRDVIGQAKGIIMSAEAVTADAAFARLARMSQGQNRPLRDIAEQIATTGQIPDGP